MTINPVIHLENIGKCYRIYANPQDRFKQALRDRFGQWLGKQDQPPLYREHWALRDVSFEVAPGEAVGILGRNGAGKSTLLQIIAGTLAPTTGKIETNGRITALLELGSGFNPEFTGRENVFHNAQILGLTREETENKFDEIAGFADIGDFLDQPVKTYSSGMMMRLAFAVQTAVEPQILIVDEALSVGDMFFQAKCMRRIDRLVNDGVSLLFVSHDLSSIQQLCKRAVLIDQGQVQEIGDARLVTDSYTKVILKTYNAKRDEAVVAQPFPAAALLPGHEETAFAVVGDEFESDEFDKRAAANRSGSFDARVINVLTLKGGAPCLNIDFDDEIEIRTYVRFYKSTQFVSFAIQFRTVQGSNVCYFDSRLAGQFEREYLAGKVYSFSCWLRLRLQHGNYIIACALSHPPTDSGSDWFFLDVVPLAANFTVAPRAGGMLGGYWAPNVEMEINEIG
jgi:lipopolysaccharide transport system ATP-binding protein